MISFCVGHHKKHEHFSWKFQDYDIDGQHKTGWFCGDFFKPTSKEWVPQRIKDDRNKYFKDLIQPWREGKPSREFIDTYPEKSKTMFTEKEKKTAKNVWRDIAPRGMKAGTK